tara:strand:- start:1162 stop:1281 length:120 start_codon:yes stop_codon:yes gene_type:complete
LLIHDDEVEEHEHGYGLEEAERTGQPPPIKPVPENSQDY